MSGTRAKKRAETIKEEVSDIISSKLKDPRVGFTTVTAVEASKDIHYVTVYVSILGDENQQKETMETLKNAAGFIRTELGTRIRIRHVPELRFVQDRAMEQHAQINALIKQINEENSHGDEKH
ncbi:MAG TPA: 30S ribosome-binding factor RbfA [Firmicutes bacterium]|jgi:ribosome-binding factor A|nr:30S ribosome-binding factor RbfA [Bacillota bacterium]HBS93993.1 30S ribosome-binding factor RbfA [Bacillota bacterium]HCX79832.1 30S ribosome-binding factor RbfA [Bacillota bacterium]